MPGSDFEDRVVELRGGMIVPVAAVLLALDLERRELRLKRDGNDLLVGPADRLTPADHVAIRRWKGHLLMLLDYHPDDRRPDDANE